MEYFREPWVDFDWPAQAWCRLFEVPATQAAISIQELQIEKRH
jgi:hypothetical protein